MAELGVRKKVALPFVSSRVQVRCLGPGPEHAFWTDDRCGHRICPKCTRVVNGEGYVAISPIYGSSLKRSGGRGNWLKDGE